MAGVAASRMWMVVIVTGGSDADHGDAQVSMAVSELAASDVARVTVAVRGPGMSPSSESLVLVGSTWQGTIGKLPVGADRTFVGSAFDANDVLLFQGTAAGVTADNTAVVMLILQRVKPSLSDRQCGAGDDCVACQLG